MHPDPYSVSTVLAVQLDKFSKQYGLDFAAICQRHSINTAELASLAGRMPCQKFAHLLEDFANLSGDPLFGLKYAHSFDMTVAGPLAQVIIYSKNFTTAWDMTRRYRQLGLNHAKLDLSNNGATSKVIWELSPYADDMPQICDFTLGISLNFYKTFGDVETEVLQINTMRKTPIDTAMHDEVFAGKVVFDSNENSVVFMSAIVERHNPKYDFMIFKYMQLQCEGLLQLYKLSRPLEDEVRQFLLRSIASNDLHLNTVAQELSMSERSLQRALSRRGFSFANLQEQTKRDFSNHLLCDVSKTIEEVAYQVGFKSTSAFSRASTLWNGKSPSIYRKELRRRLGFDRTRQLS